MAVMQLINETGVQSHCCEDVANFALRSTNWPASEKAEPHAKADSDSLRE